MCYENAADCYCCCAERALLQAADAATIYVQAVLAILTSGNMATALQYQLIASVTGPLLNALQQAGLPATKIELDSLDIEQVGAPLV